MELINGVVLGVGSASGNKGGRAWTRFDVQFSNGKTYSTFKPEISAMAVQLQGQPVSMIVNTVQRGDYTNTYLETIGPEGTLSMPEGSVENTQTTSVPQNFSANGGSDEGKRRSKEQIARESSLIAAFSAPEGLLGEPDNVEERIALAERLYGIAVDGFGQDSLTVPDLTTPEEVATTVPGVTTGADRDW